MSKTQFSFLLDDDLKESVRKVSKRDFTSLGNIIHKALRDYVKFQHQYESDQKPIYNPDMFPALTEEEKKKDEELTARFMDRANLMDKIKFDRYIPTEKEEEFLKSFIKI